MAPSVESAIWWATRISFFLFGPQTAEEIEAINAMVRNPDALLRERPRSRRRAIDLIARAHFKRR